MDAVIRQQFPKTWNEFFNSNGNKSLKQSFTDTGTSSRHKHIALDSQLLIDNDYQFHYLKNW